MWCVYDVGQQKAGERHSSWTWRGNLTFPHSVLWLFITPDGRTLAHRKWSVSATGRGGGGRSDPQHVNQAFLWGSATLEDEVVLLWKKTPERYTCHNIDTSEGVSWDPSLVPWLPGALLAWTPPSPPIQCPKRLCSRSCSPSLIPDIHQSVACNIFKSSARLLSTKTLHWTVNRRPRWSSYGSAFRNSVHCTSTCSVTATPFLKCVPTMTQSKWVLKGFSPYSRWIHLPNTHNKHDGFTLPDI